MDECRMPNAERRIEAEDANVAHLRGVRNIEQH